MRPQRPRRELSGGSAGGDAWRQQTSVWAESLMVHGFTLKVWWKSTHGKFYLDRCKQIGRVHSIGLKWRGSRNFGTHRRLSGEEQLHPDISPEFMFHRNLKEMENDNSGSFFCFQRNWRLKDENDNHDNSNNNNDTVRPAGHPVTFPSYL